MSVGAAPRDPARRRQWGDAARRDPGGGAPGGRRRVGRDFRSPRRARGAPPPPPRAAAGRPQPGDAGATCARRAGEMERGVLVPLGGGQAGATRGAGVPGRTGARARGRTHEPASGPRGAGWGRGSLRRRGQSGAGGVRAGPMAAREWALLGDRVMGWPGRCAGGGGRARSLTWPREPRAGLLPVTAAPAWSFLPDAPLRGPPREPGNPSGRIPGAPGPPPCGARPSGERAPRGHRSGTGTKEPPGRHARAHTWPLAPTRAPRRRSALRLRSLARPPGLQLRPLPTGPRSPAQRRGGHGDARGLRGPTAALPSRAPLRGPPPAEGFQTPGAEPGAAARVGSALRAGPASPLAPRRKPRGPASLAGQVPGAALRRPGPHVLPSGLRRCWRGARREPCPPGPGL